MGTCALLRETSWFFTVKYGCIPFNMPLKDFIDEPGFDSDDGAEEGQNLLQNVFGLMPPEWFTKAKYFIHVASGDDAYCDGVFKSLEYQEDAFGPHKVKGYPKVRGPFTLQELETGGVYYTEAGLKQMDLKSLEKIAKAKSVDLGTMDAAVGEAKLV